MTKLMRTKLKAEKRKEYIRKRIRDARFEFELFSGKLWNCKMPKREKFIKPTNTEKCISEVNAAYGDCRGKCCI